MTRYWAKKYSRDTWRIWICWTSASFARTPMRWSLKFRSASRLCAAQHLSPRCNCNPLVCSSLDWRLRLLRRTDWSSESSKYTNSWGSNQAWRFSNLSTSLWRVMSTLKIGGNCRTLLKFIKSRLKDKDCFKLLNLWRHSRNDRNFRLALKLVVTQILWHYPN